MTQQSYLMQTEITKLNPSRRILLTSGRSPLTLDLARQLSLGGHKIYVADTARWYLTRFSNTVEKTFVIPSPRFETESFLESIKKIAETERIDLIVPVYEEVLYLANAQDRLPKHCKLFSSPFELLHRLHNKWEFYLLQKSLNIPVADTYLVKSNEEVQKVQFKRAFALKASYSRASLSVIKVRPGQTIPEITIEPYNPWMAQEWIEGKQLCSYSVCHNGSLLAHGAYPVRYAIGGTSCITFEATKHPAIFEWVKHFIKLTNFTGQIAFDFIESFDGKLYAIECNPRATSGVHLFRQSEGLVKAFLNEAKELIQPKEGRSRQLAIGMMLYGWKKSSYPSNSMMKFLRSFLSKKDVVFSLRDPMPFFSQPFAFVEVLRNCRKFNMSLPASFTYDFEWNGERYMEKNINKLC